MRVLQINAVPYGSTGRIMFQLADAVAQAGGKTLCTAGFTWKKANREDFVITSNIFEKTLHTYLARATGKTGCFSYFSTKRFLRKVEEFQPEIIHLHNLHGWFINLPMLFKYIKEKNIPVVWTLHDCWSFTGHCPHFDMVGCDKYKTGCYHCPLYCQYPQTFFDYSKEMYENKKQWFTGVEQMTIVTPSRWLADRVQESFLGNYPVEVIHNGIDLSVFLPRHSDVREKYNFTGKYIVLGVAYAWDDKKGLDVFVKLANRLSDDYQIVLVGTDDKIDKILPKNIVSIHRTQNAQELAAIYAAADVFVNPTREENYPTVNMEALACGTPAVTFETGGSPETVDRTTGVVVAKNDVLAMAAAIKEVCEGNTIQKQNCIERAKEFDMQISANRYMELYCERITAEGI